MLIIIFMTMTIRTLLWLRGRVVNCVGYVNYADDNYADNGNYSCDDNNIDDVDDDNSHPLVAERQGCRGKPSTRPRVRCK